MKKTTGRFFLMLFFLAALCAVPTVRAAAGPKNTLLTSGKYTYYYDSNGEIVRNKFVILQKKTYFFDKEGHMLRKVIFSIGEKTYCATKDGSLAQNKVVTYKKKKYFFDGNGLRKVGWVTYKGHRYYFLNAGDYLKNCWKKIGQYYYYFNGLGRICQNTWVDDYYVDGSGHRLPVKAKAPKKEKNSKKIRMETILQNPELPTGCESVALTMVLRYYGFNISKTTIASNYLPLSDSGNFVTAFAGSPFSPDGAGIYAPGLANTANNFLKAKKSSLRAYDVSGMSLKKLYRFLDNNTPVIVWNSMYMRTPVPYDRTIQVLGKSWRFYRSEHCVVLLGYNKKKNQVLVNDSLSGLVWRDASAFERIYNTLGKMAVVIQ